MTRRTAIIGVSIVVVLYAFYAGLMIFMSSVVWEGSRWFCLLDDAMVSMRYARNVASGYGLVWNTGERIEGITNPGWTFVMALVHVFEDNRALTSLYIQLISAVSLVAVQILTAMLAWNITRGSAAVTIVATAITAFFYPLNYFSLNGMETGILALILTASILLFLKNIDRIRFTWLSYLLLGCATLIRMDAAVPLVILGVFGAVTAEKEKRAKHLVSLFGILVLFIGGQTIARLYYYGSPLPNTYYLKMTGFPLLQRIVRGLIVLWQPILCFFWPVAGMAITVLIKCRFQRRSMVSYFGGRYDLRVWTGLILLLLICSGQFAYSAYVGGDAWEWIVYVNRYIVIAVPLLAITWTVCIKELLQELIPTQLLLPVRSAIVFAGAITGVFLTNFMGCSKPSLLEAAFLRPARMSVDSEVAIATADRLSPLAADAVVSSDWAGALPYFLDCYTVDPLGKCDKFIARLEVPKAHWESPRWEAAFYPGHMKWDAEYTLSKYQPDYLVFRWPRLAMDFAPLLKMEHELLLDHIDGLLIFHRNIAHSLTE